MKFDKSTAGTLAMLALLLGIGIAGHYFSPLVLPKAAARGAGWVEGWRGEVLVTLETVPDGASQRIQRCHCHDPSWHNWPVLEHAILGNIVPDFPLINKSFNLSYSGHDL